jgi:hypothetical protein
MPKNKNSSLARLVTGFWIMNLLLALVVVAGWLVSSNTTVRAIFISPTPTATETPTSTPSQTPSITPSPTLTPSPTETFTPTFAFTDTQTPTLTPEPLRVSFAVIGDFGMNNAAEADVAALIDSWQPEIVVALGDNNYPSGLAETIDDNIGQYFHEYIFPYVGSYGSGATENRFFPILGNHDWNTTVGAQAHLDYFTLPGNERYYEFTWGPVHFFALDSCLPEPDGIRADSIQATWLQQGLAASTSPWNVVLTHYPPYSSGYHGSISWIQWPFAAWGADVVMAGHDHNYERLLVDDILYFVNGLGGQTPRFFKDVPLRQSQFRYNDDHGAMRVTATETEVLFEFYNRLGELIDSYRMTQP